MGTLGKYIHLVDVRNTDLKIEKLLGISMNKEFRPSTSNVIGTDLSKYKIVNPMVFAFDTMSVIRVHKVPIVLNKLGEPIIISPAYTTFEINDTNVLDPLYLSLWFKRPDFDRYGDFKSDAAVRGGYNWEELCETPINLPDITEQRRIVNEYQTVERRIKNNEALIQKLEETAQAIYHHTFVENIDENNLPDGWKNISIKDFCKETKSGGTPDRGRKEYWDKDDYRWLKSGEVQNNVVLDVEEWISEEGLNNSSAKVIPAGSVIMAMYGATAAQVAYLNCDATTNQACCNMLCKSHDEAAYLYFALKAKQNTIKVLANGGAQENLSQELIVSQSIIQPKNCEPLKPFAVLLDNIVSVSRELHHLRTLQSLLTSKLA